MRLNKKALAKLSPEEQKKAIEAFDEAQRIIKANPLLRYNHPRSAKKHPQQIEFHAARTKVKGIVGGNRSGKSAGGVVDDLIQLVDADCLPPHLLAFKKWTPPTFGRIVAPKFNENIEGVILPTIREWVPKGQLKGGSFSRAYSKQRRVLNFANGSTLQFLCFRGDQRALLPDGRWKPVSEIAVDEEVQTRFGPKRVVRSVAYPEAPLLKVRASGGHEIVATPNHPHRLADGKWVTTEELVPGDQLDTRRDCGDGEATFEEWEYGWLALMIGDGCVTGSCLTPSVTIDRASPLRNELPPLPPQTRLRWGKSADRTQALFLATTKNKGNPLKALLERVGLWGCGSHDKFVPDEIFRQPPAIRAKFLRWLWATDGTWDKERRQASYSTCSRRLALDVKYLLWSLDISAAVCEFTANPAGFRKRASQHFHVNVYGDFNRFAEFVGRAGENSPALDAKLGPRRPGVVRDITPVDNAPVYCVEVDEVNELIVDGIVTSNTFDQDLDAHAGAALHFVHFDEEPEGEKGLALFNESMMRLVDYDGDFKMTWTPLFGLSWSYKRLWKNRDDPNITVVQVDSEMNPHINQAALAASWSEMTDEEVKARKRGEFVHFGGMFYPEFSDTDHVVPAPLPEHVKDQSIVVGIDPGLRRAGVVWTAFDSENAALVFEEHYPAEATVTTLAASIHKINQAWGITPDYYVIDPSARNRATVNAEAVQNVLLREGIPTIQGQNDRAAGIFEVKRRLQAKGPDGEPAPALLVSEACQNLKNEFETYRRDPNSADEFAAVKEDDHEIDALRYLLMSRPWTVDSPLTGEPEPWKPGYAPTAGWLERAGPTQSPPLGAMT